MKKVKKIIALLALVLAVVLQPISNPIGHDIISTADSLRTSALAPYSNSHDSNYA